MSIVTAQWLKSHLKDADVRTVDASWHLPAAARDARKEFDTAHIPGAVFFDIDAHSAPVSLPHMMPDVQQFALAAGSLGISENHTIVVYDTIGMFSAARVWWMFRHFGAERVCVLDGGLPAWQRAGGEMEARHSGSMAAGIAQTDSAVTPCQFRGKARDRQAASEVADASRVQAAMNDGSVILDVRSAGRFSGVEKEVREGLRSGHIPGSLNLPFVQVLDEQGCFKSVPELVELFDSLGLQQEDQIITSCGSGVTAAILLLALELAGYQNVSLYDGSWTEWGALEGVPVASG